MLLLISLAAFYISLQEPRDPVEIIIGSPQDELDIGADKPNLGDPIFENRKIKLRQRLNLDKPLFYVALSNIAVPDTLHKIQDKETRSALHRLIFHSGNWEAVERYHESLKTLKRAHQKLEQELILAKAAMGKKNSFSDSLFIQHEIRTTTSNISNESLDSLPESNTRVKIDPFYQPNMMLNKSYGIVKNLPKISNTNLIQVRLDTLKNIYNDPYLASLKESLIAVQHAFHQLEIQATPWKLYVPTIHSYGWDTQYHHWLSGVVTKLDFGISYRTKQDVAKSIRQKIPWSFFFALVSTLLIYVISIPLGIWTAYKQGSRLDRWMRNSLFALDAIPSFWMAYLLILIFANTDVLDWFPSTFNTNQWGRFVLPLIAYTYGGLAFLSRQVRINVLAIGQEEYILAARSRGISERTIWRKHILKNALLPLITIFGALFPALVGGSVILEHVFAIPGMGGYILSFNNFKDLPVIVAVFTLLGCLTMIGYLFSDILYRLADPRIRF